MKVRLFLAAASAAVLISGTQGALAAPAAPAHAPAGAPAAAPAASSPLALDIESCIGSSFCLATGSQPGHGFVPLNEEWNGKTWRIIPNPSTFADQITCGGPTFCLASELRIHTRVEIGWNGRSWRRFTPQPPNGRVACFSLKFCVGLNNDVSGEVYWTGGTTWPPMPGTSAGCGGAFCGIDGFGCGSATNCWDSGSYCGDSDCDSGIFDYSDAWNGTTWTSINGPGFSGQESCAGRSFCMILDSPKLAAVSNDWGQTWPSAATHLAAACRLANCVFTGSAVPACASMHFCLAVPSANSLGILAWNGTKWGVSKLALIAGHRPKVTALACGSPTNCMASGTYQRTPRGATQPAMEHWNGKSWKVTPIAKP